MSSTCISKDLFVQIESKQFILFGINFLSILQLPPFYCSISLIYVWMKSFSFKNVMIVPSGLCVLGAEINYHRIFWSNPSVCKEQMVEDKMLDAGPSLQISANMTLSYCGRISFSPLDIWLSNGTSKISITVSHSRWLLSTNN